MASDNKLFSIQFISADKNLHCYEDWRLFCVILSLKLLNFEDLSSAAQRNLPFEFLFQLTGNKVL